MIRQLKHDDIESFIELRREALAESPLAFASSPADDINCTLETLRIQIQQKPDSVIFGAFQENLIGSVGLYRDRHLKYSHKAHLWGMYVAQLYRRQGFGMQLLLTVLDHARKLPNLSQVQLSVSSAALSAKRLYEKAGFHIWGTEEDALRYEHHTLTEYYMVFHLD